MTDWGLPRADGSYAQTMGRRQARLPSADEMPAQPTHSDPGEPCTHPFCVAKAEAEANATPEEREAAQRHGVPVNVLRDIRADRPAVVAGRADEDDVYHELAVRAYAHLGANSGWTVEELEADLHDEQQGLDVPTLLAIGRGFMAELAEVTRERDRANRAAENAKRELDATIRERDEARADVERLTVGKCFDAAPRLLGSVSTVMCTLAHGHRDAHTDGQATWTNMDEARAKAVDGGEWVWEWGHAGSGVALCRCISASHANAKRVKRRVWEGPVEPVTDDGSGT